MEMVKKFQKTRKDFLHQLELDRIKNSYALAKGYMLLRIPYWDIDYIKSFNDLFDIKYIVKNKYHNDLLYQMQKNCNR